MSGPRERVLVTGASSGIGLELARLFAAEGCDLVLLARREDRLVALAEELEAAHDIRTRVLPMDLCEAGAVGRLHQLLSQEDLPVHVLVNNAGFGVAAPFTGSPLERQSAMIRLNVDVLTELCHRFLPEMKQRGAGGVLNVASTAGFQPGPSMAVYYATKAFVLHFTEAIREELRGTGLHVTALCPGPTWTEFMDVAGLGHPPLFDYFSMQADRAARAGHGGFRRNRSVVIPGFGNKLGTLLVRIFPRTLVPRVVRRIITPKP